MLDLNTINHGDCLDLLQNVPSNSIDLVVTDPPYGISYGEWDRIDFSAFTDEWCAQVFRVLRKRELFGHLWGMEIFSSSF